MRRRDKSLFDKKALSNLLKKARGEKTNTDLAQVSQVSRAYISSLINMGLKQPPSPSILKRIANVSDVTYEDLMKTCGYLPRETKTENNTSFSKTEQSIKLKLLCLVNGDEYLDVEFHGTKEELEEKVNKRTVISIQFNEKTIHINSYYIVSYEFD